jgi:hypothetical protein
MIKSLLIMRGCRTGVDINIVWEWNVSGGPRRRSRPSSGAIYNSMIPPLGAIVTAWVRSLTENMIM